jgi:AraC-like DNA-binding protein
LHNKLKLLWVNLRISADAAEPDPLLNSSFDISICGRESGIAEQFKLHKPDAVCFDFDYPDRAGLRLAKEIKQLFSSLPMFVATVEHSEELAIWAFRSAMMDFLVKPLSGADLDRCYATLKQKCDARRKQKGRVISKSEQLLPASAVSNSKEPDLEPALYYVEQNYRSKIPAEDVAKLCGMSAFRFSRFFKETYGIAFRDYVVRYRLREAYRMLKTGHASVTEAAYANGFNDIGYFSRTFKHHFSISPSAVGKTAEPASVPIETAEPDSVPTETAEPTSAPTEDDSPTVSLRLPMH